MSWFFDGTPNEVVIELEQTPGVWTEIGDKYVLRGGIRFEVPTTQKPKKLSFPVRDTDGDLSVLELMRVRAKVNGFYVIAGEIQLRPTKTWGNSQEYALTITDDTTLLETGSKQIEEEVFIPPGQSDMTVLRGGAFVVPGWQPNAKRIIGDYCQPNPVNLSYYRVTDIRNPDEDGQGTSGSSQPAFPTTPLATVDDGNLVWTCMGSTIWGGVVPLYCPEIGVDGIDTIITGLPELSLKEMSVKDVLVELRKHQADSQNFDWYVKVDPVTGESHLFTTDWNNLALVPYAQKELADTPPFTADRVGWTSYSRTRQGKVINAQTVYGPNGAKGEIDGSVGPEKTFTINTETNRLVCFSHGFQNGDVVFLRNDTGEHNLPNPFREYEEGVRKAYYVAGVFENTFYLTYIPGGNQITFKSVGGPGNNYVVDARYDQFARQSYVAYGNKVKRGKAIRLNDPKYGTNEACREYARGKVHRWYAGSDTIEIKSEHMIDPDILVAPRLMKITNTAPGEGLDQAPSVCGNVVLSFSNQGIAEWSYQGGDRYEREGEGDAPGLRIGQPFPKDNKPPARPALRELSNYWDPRRLGVVVQVEFDIPYDRDYKFSQIKWTSEDGVILGESDPLQKPNRAFVIPQVFLPGYALRVFIRSEDSNGNSLGYDPFGLPIIATERTGDWQVDETGNVLGWQRSYGAAAIPAHRLSPDGYRGINSLEVDLSLGKWDLALEHVWMPVSPGSRITVELACKKMLGRGSARGGVAFSSDPLDPNSLEYRTTILATADLIGVPLNTWVVRKKTVTVPADTRVMLVWLVSETSAQVGDPPDTVLAQIRWAYPRWVDNTELGDIDLLPTEDKSTLVAAIDEIFWFRQEGLGAWERSVLAKLREVLSVQDAGAVGDGVTDDTASVQAAVTAAVASGRHLYFPRTAAGYKLLGTVTISGPLHLKGEGATIIPAIPDGAGISKTFDVQSSGVEFHGLTFTNASVTPPTGVRYLIWANSADPATWYESIRIVDCKFLDLIHATAKSPTAIHPIYLQHIKHATIRDCEFDNIGGTACFLRSTDEALIAGNRINDVVWYNIHLDVDNQGFVITKNRLTGTKPGIRNYGGSIDLMGQHTTGKPGERYGVVTNNYIGGVHSYGNALRIASSQKVIVANNTFDRVTCTNVISITSRGATNETVWTPATPKALNARVIPTDGDEPTMKVTTPGTTGTTEPDWPDVGSGASVPDGTVVWTEVPSTQGNNGPVRNISIVNNIMTAGRPGQRGIYVQNSSYSDPDGIARAYRIGIEGNQIESEDDPYWVSNYRYQVNERFRPDPTNGFSYACTEEGVSGATLPALPTTLGSTVVVGTATFVCVPENEFYFSAAISVHGQDGGIDDVQIINNFCHGTPSASNPVAGLIGLIRSSGHGTMTGYLVANNTLKFKGTATSTSNVGIMLGQYVDVVRCHGNAITGFWYGVRVMPNAGPTIVGLPDNTFVNCATDVLEYTTALAGRGYLPNDGGTTANRPSASSTTGRGFVPGRHYFNTTLGKPEWWDGTEWRGDEIALSLAFRAVEFQPFATSPQDVYTVALSDDEVYRLRKWAVTYITGATNDAANFWTVALLRVATNGTTQTMASFTTAGTPPNTRDRAKITATTTPAFLIQTASGATHTEIMVRITKTGAPSALQLRPALYAHRVH